MLQFKRSTMFVGSSKPWLVLAVIVSVGLIISAASDGKGNMPKNSPAYRPNYQASNAIVCVGGEKTELVRVTLPEERRELAAAAGGSSVIVCGGRNKDGFLTADTYIISLNGQVKKVRALPQPRCRHGMANAGDGKVVVAGGVTQEKDGTLALAKDVVAYDPNADTWEHITDLPNKTAQCVVEVVDNRLFIIAGDTGATTEPGRHIAPAKCRGEVQIFDFKSGKWLEGTKKPTPETGVTSAIRNNEIFVVSSYTDDGKVSALVEVYDVKQDKWRRIPDMPTARTGVACGFLKDKLYCVNGLGSDLRSHFSRRGVRPADEQVDEGFAIPLSIVCVGLCSLRGYADDRGWT